RIRLLPGAPRALKQWAPVHVHIGAAHLAAHVALLDAEALFPGSTALVQLVLEKPHCACHGDVFVLRNPSSSRTIGGGRVLDPDAPARGRRTNERFEVLAALESSEPTVILGSLLADAPFGVDLARCARSFNLPVDALARPGGDLRRVKSGAIDIAFSP